MAFDREKILQTAQKYIEKRKYDRAIAEYEKVVQHEPNDARTLLRIGDLQSRIGAHPQAIATYDRVALYYSGRGFSLKAVAVLKQISELIERHAPQLSDQYGHVLPKLAQIYGELGLTNDALATYDTIARRFQDQGRDRDAVEIIRRMVALDRTNPLPYLRLAEALCRVSRVDEAMEHFWGAAQMLTQQGRQDDALKVLERMLHFRQEVRVARVAAELYLAKRNRDAGLAALSRLQMCFEADPRDLDTLILLAQAFDVIGQPGKGVEVYKEMVRIASETGQQDVRDRYLQHLTLIAPNDEQVRGLAAMHGIQPSERPPPPALRSSMPAEVLSEDDIEFLEDDVVEAAPESLRVRSAAPPARGQASEPVRASRSAAPVEREPAASAFLRKALVDAESFRGLKLYAKASAALKHALVAAPESLELRAALQQVLLEAGDRTGAIEQALAVARIYVRRGSVPAAEAELHQLLDLAPNHPAALRLLEELEALGAEARRALSRSVPGRSVGVPDRADAPPPSEHEAPFELRPRVSGRPSLSNAVANAKAAPPSPPTPPTPPPIAAVADEPLPAYELDDADISIVSDAPAALATPTPEAPLPQFSLDSGLHGAPGSASTLPEAAHPTPSAAPGPLSQKSAPAHRDSIRAALDEADFFSSRGLYQDASLILKDRLDQYPGDAELIGAIAQLEPKLNTESGTRDVGRLSVDPLNADDEITEATMAPKIEIPPLTAVKPSISVEVPSARGKELRVQFSTDGTFAGGGPIIDADADADLLSSLDEEPVEQVDVDEVFAKFKQGVKAQISDNDSATHYDLGVAYKEMGLLADAAREFEIASRDPKRECNCLAMMGMMYRERGELDRAAEAYVRGLNAGQKTISQEVSLYYDLGITYEQKDDPDEAIYYFQRITNRDPTYRDVAQRLKLLLPRSRRFSQPARAINDDQDFDRSFDDLYKE